MDDGHTRWISVPRRRLYGPRLGVGTVAGAPGAEPGIRRRDARARTGYDTADSGHPTHSTFLAVQSAVRYRCAHAGYSQ